MQKRLLNEWIHGVFGEIHKTVPPNYLDNEIRTANMKNTFDILAANVVRCRVGYENWRFRIIDTRVIRLENGTHWRRQYSITAVLGRQHRPVIHTVDSS